MPDRGRSAALFFAEMMAVHIGLLSGSLFVRQLHFAGGVYELLSFSRVLNLIVYFTLKQKKNPPEFPMGSYCSAGSFSGLEAVLETDGPVEDQTAGLRVPGVGAEVAEPEELVPVGRHG